MIFLKVLERVSMIFWGKHRSICITPQFPDIHATPSIRLSVLYRDICHKHTWTTYLVYKCKPHNLSFEGILSMEAVSVMTLQVRICGWDRFLVRRLEVVSQWPSTKVRAIEGWRMVSRARLEEEHAALKINPTPVVAA